MGVELPKGYAERVSEDGLRLCDQLGVTKLGIGVVLHTAPETPKELPSLLGYAESTGQWFGDCSKYARDEDVRHAHEGGRADAHAVTGPRPLPEQLTVVAWLDAVADGFGHPADSPYTTVRMARGGWAVHYPGLAAPGPNCRRPPGDQRRHSRAGPEPRAQPDGSTRTRRCHGRSPGWSPSGQALGTGPCSPCGPRSRTCRSGCTNGSPLPPSSPTSTGAARPRLAR